MSLLMEFSCSGTSHEVIIEIGGIPIALQTTDAGFVDVLQDRYGDYVKSGVTSEFTFCVEVVPPGTFEPRR